MADTGDTPSDRLRERAAQSRLKLWVLLEADRWLVTALLIAVVFTTFVATGYLYPPAETAIRSSDSVDTLFQALLTATITGVTLILTLNQLVLSQELGAVKDQRERMEGAIQFRNDVADTLDMAVAPAHPSAFLRVLVTAAGERARILRESIPPAISEEGKTAIEDFTDSLIENAAGVSTGLEGASFGHFEVLSSALNFNYSWKIFAGRQLREQYGDELESEATKALDELIEVLELFGPAREHFKTLYFQWDLINLSRRILVAAIPALLVSGCMVLFFEAARYNVVVFHLDTLIILITGATTIALAPFLILLAYVMRIATVTKHTLSIGPFILRDTESSPEKFYDGMG